MNRLPTERDNWSAMMMSMMLGGMRIPSVPAEATTPLAKEGE